MRSLSPVAPVLAERASGPQRRQTIPTSATAEFFCRADDVARSVSQPCGLTSHEICAAVAAYWRGEKVVDLWGGRRTPDGDAPWNEDTMVVVMSTTKGLAAMALAVANSRGWLDYDAPVARYWPEFAQNGKATVTV